MTPDLLPHLLSLPEVSPQRMFGADCFLAQGRMFAFLQEDGVVLKLPEERYGEALALPGVAPFTMRGAPFGKWARFPAGDIGGLLPWVRAAYDHVLAEPPKPRRRRSTP